MSALKSYLKWKWCRFRRHELTEGSASHAWCGKCQLFMRMSNSEAYSRGKKDCLKDVRVVLAGIKPELFTKDNILNFLEQLIEEPFTGK